MEPSNKPADGASAAQNAPQDALEKTSDELAESIPAQPITASVGAGGKPPKKPNALKALFKRFNVYLLLFLLIVVVAVVVSVVAYLNSKKTPTTPSVTTQQLTEDTLKQLANSDATVGDSGQTLTVQGNAVFSGQVLIRSNLNVAGTIQTGEPMTLPGLTVSGSSNLAATQISSLQVATGSTFQGVVTLQDGLNVAGTAAFNGPITASQITVTKLILSGNAQIEIPNHIAFTGPSPGRTFNATPLGNGGSASVNGSDTTGTVNANSGSNPSTGCFITVTFNQKFTDTPHVIVTPIGSAAGSTGWYVNRSTTSFSVCFSSPPTANQAFAFDYFVTD